jgi:hypothetical protein
MGATGDLVLKPSQATFVVFTVFLGVPMLLGWYTVLSHGLTGGSMFLSIATLPVILIVLLLWAGGQRVIIDENELRVVKWYRVRNRIQRSDIESFEVGVKLKIKSRVGVDVSIPLNIYPIDARRAIQAFVEKG